MRRILKNPMAAIALALIIILVFIAVFADLLAPNDPMKQNLLAKYHEPSEEYPLGADQLGRCVLSRLIYGARYSLGVSIPIVAVLGAIGLILGGFAAFAPKLVRAAVKYLCDVFIALPAVVVAAALTGLLGNSILSLVGAVILAMWAWFVRMAASYAQTELAKDYMAAVRIAGCGTFKAVFLHLIPNIFPQYLVYLSTGIAATIVTVSGFAFLGLGFSAGTPEWGAMLDEARRGIYSHPELLIYPGACVAVAAGAFNLFGEALRDMLERGDSR